MRIRFVMAAALACGLSVFSLQAQQPPSPLLKIEEQRQAAAKKKIDEAITAALANAQRLQQSGSKNRAIDELRAAMRLLDDPILNKDFAESRRNQLFYAIKVTEAGERPALEATPAPAKTIDTAKLQAMIEADKDIRRSLETVNALMKAGATDQAKKEVDALAKKYPDNPTVILMPDLVNKTKTLDDIREVHVRQMENIRLALVDLQKTSTLPKGNVEFPADWKDLTARRKTQVSPEMQAVLKALRTPIPMDITNQPIGDVLKSISAKMKLPIILDKATMQEVGIDVSSPVSVSTGLETSARMGLKKTLSNFNLTYIVKNGVIHVVTPDKAAQTMETRVYYIGDLVSGTGSTIGAARFGPFGPEADRQAMMKNVEQLIDQIKKMDPSSWKGGGSDGKGEITYHSASMALIVKASAEVHGLLGNTFSK